MITREQVEEMRGNCILTDAAGEGRYYHYAFNQLCDLALRGLAVDEWVTLSAETLPTTDDSVLVVTQQRNRQVVSGDYVRWMWKDAQGNGEDCNFVYWRELPPPPARPPAAKESR